MHDVRILRMVYCFNVSTFATANFVYFLLKIVQRYIQLHLLKIAVILFVMEFRERKNIIVQRLAVSMSLIAVRPAVPACDSQVVSLSGPRVKFEFFWSNRHFLIAHCVRRTRKKLYTS